MFSKKDYNNSPSIVFGNMTANSYCRKLNVLARNPTAIFTSVH